ncbi:MAG: hypothetical protein WEE89_07175 [Gemmatimonadota bacterium]
MTAANQQECPDWLDVDYPSWMAYLLTLPESDRSRALRYACRTDLYFLLRYALHRADIEHPWLLARIREVQESPDGHLDLWARGHFKSSIITFGKTVQDILASHGEEPLPMWKGVQPCFAIFSHTRPEAKKFLRQIKYTLEGSLFLRELFPDILWRSAQYQSPKWSENEGLVVKRNGTQKESTVEAWGLIDGMPTGRHFQVLIYDDLITERHVTNPDMMTKVESQYRLSFNLGDAEPRVRVIGTRYHFGDLYGRIIKEQTAKPRLYPATIDGALTGDPVYLSREQLDKKVRDMGPYISSAQLMQNPIADSKQSFARIWLRFYTPNTVGGARQMYRMLICDPANEKKKSSDWTTMGVLGAGPDHNLYLLDYVRDRLNLQERAQAFIRLHRKWQPQFTGYEKYGKDSDIAYIKEVQEREVYRFDVRELGGQLSKFDRVNRLVPVCAERRYYLPERLIYTGYDHKPVDLIEQFVNEEYAAWPVPLHDDGLDMMSRVFDEGVMIWPRGADEQATKRDRYSKEQRRSWMSA